MNFSATRLAIVLLGDRLVGAALRGAGVEAFTVQAEAPAEGLREALAARGLAPRSVALGLARGKVFVKPIDLPAVAGELADMVRFELDRHLPFPTEDAPFDFVPIPAAASGEPAEGGARVLVAAADRRVVEAVLRVAADARLRPLSLTVAAHDLVALARPPKGKRIVWAHRAEGETDLLFLADGALALSRGIPSVDGAVVTDEIQRTLIAFRWRSLDAVWRSGDAAGADTALAQLGAPVGEPAWNPPARRRLAALPADSRGAFMLALAVASRRGARPLDLLPAPLRPWRLTRAQRLTAVSFAAMALLGIGALLTPTFLEQRHLTHVSAELARIDPDFRAVERVDRELKRKRRVLETVDAVQGAALRPLPVLRELTEILPGDAWLTSLTLEPKGVELTGQAQTASVLIPILENSPRLMNVEFASPVTRGRDREQFRIRATWEGGTGVAPRPGGPAP
ncbi:MAG: PilN domain-containing protein, partial [Candidatus Rokuibacteriota bacterium]